MATQILQGFMTCERCGNCCKNAPAIELTYADLLSIAKHFSIPVEEARQLYARSANDLGSGKIAIKCAQPCMFYVEGAGCSIYEHKPKACEQYPFVASSSGKVVIHKKCPGVVKALETLEKIKEHTKTCQVCKTYGSAVCEEVKKILGKES